MRNANTWFDIPVADLAAAQHFYERLLDRPMRGTEDLGGDTMLVFAHDKPGAGGCLAHRPGHKATEGGTVVYLDCAPSVQAALDRAVEAGGQVVTPRTLIAPEVGYFALLRDPEGNLVGLHATE